MSDHKKFQEALIRKEVERGFDERSTRAALEAGMSWADIRERDRRAEEVMGDDALRSIVISGTAGLTKEQATLRLLEMCEENIRDLDERIKLNQDARQYWCDLHHQLCYGDKG